MTGTPETHAHNPLLGKRGAFEGVARRHRRRRNPARRPPRSSLRPPTNPPRHSPQRWVEKVGRSIKGSETPHRTHRNRQQHQQSRKPRNGSREPATESRPTNSRSQSAMHTPPTGRSPNRPNDYSCQGRALGNTTARPGGPKCRRARPRAGTAAEDRARPNGPATEPAPPPTGWPGELPIAADDRSEFV